MEHPAERASREGREMFNAVRALPLRPRDRPKIHLTLTPGGVIEQSVHEAMERARQAQQRARRAMIERAASEIALKRRFAIQAERQGRDFGR